jgi:hypothetical protein
MQRRTFIEWLALAGGAAPAPGLGAAAAAASGAAAAPVAPPPAIIGIGTAGRRVLAALAQTRQVQPGRCLLIEPRDGADPASDLVAPAGTAVLDFPASFGETTLGRYVACFERLVPRFVERGGTVLVIGHASEMAGCELTLPVARAARAAGARVECVLLCRRSR